MSVLNFEKKWPYHHQREMEKIEKKSILKFELNFGHTTRGK
jgi:hypothetical protein